MKKLGINDKKISIYEPVFFIRISGDCKEQLIKREQKLLSINRNIAIISYEYPTNETIIILKSEKLFPWEVEFCKLAVKKEFEIFGKIIGIDYLSDGIDFIPFGISN